MASQRHKGLLSASLGAQRYPGNAKQGLDHLVPPGTGKERHIEIACACPSPFAPGRAVDRDICFATRCMAIYGPYFETFCGFQLDYLKDVVKLEPAAIQAILSTSALPWSLKPLYGLLADRVPIMGYHFRPWLAISSIGSACFYVFMAFCVDTIGGAFLVRRSCAAASTHTQPAACLPPA